MRIAESAESGHIAPIEDAEQIEQAERSEHAERIEISRQIPIFDERPAPAGSAARRPLPVLGEQSDIRYLGIAARSVLNGPETTGMGFWSVNPYVGCAFGCMYCYARYTHRYVRARHGVPFDAEAAEMPGWLAFERRVLVKHEAPQVLRRTLHAMARSPERWARLRRETIVVGTATDPYQPAERRFRITRGVLEALAEHAGLGVTIITKSPLVTRDVDVLARLATLGRMTVHVTITTLDRELARRIEPRAPTPEARLRAVARLREAGIDVGVNVMPVLPGITDRPEALDALLRRIAEAGATHVGACALRLRSDARDRYLPFIEREFPALAERYRGAYARRHELGDRYRAGLRAFVAARCAEHGVRFGYADDADDADDAPAEVPPPQLALAL